MYQSNLLIWLHQVMWKYTLKNYTKGLLLLLFFLSSDLMAQGEQVFGAHCSRCHTPKNMTDIIHDKWLNRSISEFFSVTKNTMPGESPGSLSDQDYHDVVEFMLKEAEIGLKNDAFLTSDYKITLKETQEVLSDVEWQNFGGNLNAQRYSPLTEINSENAKELKIAWRWKAENFGPAAEIRNVSMPIMRNGKVFIGAGATRNIVAIDAETGQTLWMWRPNEGERFEVAARKDSGKGVAYYEHKNGNNSVIAVTPGYYLVSLDAETGVPNKEFGENGWVDLTKGLRRAPNRELDIGLTSPALVVGDVIVVGSAHDVSFRPPSKANVKGDVRGFDASTGELLWIFHTIPEPDEDGYDTWFNDSALYTGNAGVWAPMSADEEAGLVFLPVESATGDQYGGDRHGDNLCANCLIALDARTGEMQWFYQLIHHDIWDWDNPTAPIVADLANGKRIVAQVTKQGFVYVFDRQTGVPVWPINEQKVPQTDVPGEWTSKTQPIPSLPLPFERQGVSLDDLIDYTPEIRDAVLQLIKNYRLGPLFTPPSIIGASDGTDGTLSLPYSTGGANWEGSAFDPETGLLFVPSQTRVGLMQLVNEPESSDIKYISGNAPLLKVFDIPAAKPPWGRITAIDLNTGQHQWVIANGETPKDIRDNPALKGVDLPRTGKHTRSGIVVTKTLLFAGEGFGGDPVFRAHNKLTGEITAEINLPASQASPPSTYRYKGKQYIIMTVANGRSPAELIALALSD
ncbi:MAG: PQQ-binding-like beta-propeller repeat protein [Porticoccaceae bacterium]|nr:PQQ-binding-like beta-propeller repeat protein [Porticoccaceae bacterium]